MKRSVLPALALASALACRSAAPPRAPFLLDPRGGLSGTFPADVDRGCAALLAGDVSRAEQAFSREPANLAARIGLIDVRLIQGSTEAADRLCRELFSGGVQTAPALAACAEAAARSDRWDESFDLLQTARLREPDNPALAELSRAAAPRAADQLIDDARGALADGEPDEAEEAIARALGLRPRDPEADELGARIAAARGQTEIAWKRIVSAADLRPADSSVNARAADQSFGLGRYETAARLYERLARGDATFAARARESREESVISNWPARDRDAAHALRLTRAQALVLLWRLLPRIRTVAVPEASPVATDILLRPDQDVLSRFVQMGLLRVDRETHRARPDSAIGRIESAELLFRSAELAGAALPAGCGRANAEDDLSRAIRCGLLPAEAGRGVSGTEFRRGISLLTGPERR